MTATNEGFIRIKCFLKSEFAKEAMTCQALDCKEILSIRWAKDDPMPLLDLIGERKSDEGAGRATVPKPHERRKGLLQLHDARAGVADAAAQREGVPPGHRST